jgi:hypothetical protein
MAAWTLPKDVAFWIANLAGMLHEGNAWRLMPLVVGMLFARGRRTVSSWLRGGELGDDYRGYYYFLGSLGRKVKALAGRLLRVAVDVIEPGEKMLFAIDDTPTKRYGPQVEGAGIHHNPTPGPAGQKFVYGHVWVTLAWVVRHSLWGTIGLPILACLYVRQKDVSSIVPWYGIKFETKLQQAAWLIGWLAGWLKSTGKKLWVVVDGAYVKHLVIESAKQAGVTLVGRLRKDAALWSVPDSPPPGKRRRGRPCTYGAKRISLAKRAGHRGGWSRDEFSLYGKTMEVCYKTFLATYKPAGGLIRVVLVRDDEDKTWRAYMCTDPNATVADILEAVADRAAIEQDFHDLKEVHGAGQQQVRNYWANIAVYHLSMWLHTLIELWAWHKPALDLIDRSASPWDDASRRPSHADRRNALCAQCIDIEFQLTAAAAAVGKKIVRLWKRLRDLAA